VRTIWAIYRADLRRAHRSLIASVVVFGLVVIPSLFTWFNVAASWDPFGNTRSLRIAIANTDAGYKSDLVPLRINIGDSVVSALRKNDNFDWVIDSQDAAIEGTRSGAYYAAIVMVGIHHFHARNSFTLQNQAVPVRFMLHTGHLNQHLWHINL